ncbi:hypothetical protein BAUCODRAFT_149847 [Baudoinia panamericana UAMH 10762]|uniref:FAD dependent oxidoreductase domain-containing protein n=1 Tax=Baudoinia panamericana (strain UAMH 10762) TaxID=717646 RepID=M2MT89_BAUPA|nr:uncharacterized protein BAUCODRAFT_149847 [Baudoinia panamericana UAMH 10762]EMC94743.1 hypothetical protein BAUCODRAFT_149847 [Baudoinia panamericana UAMH 10762]
MHDSLTVSSDKGSILIVGAGTWGTAIAYRLAREGYRHITVLDGQTFPSATAAGNDLNKIMEEPEDYPHFDNDNDNDYAWNVIEGLATDVWKSDPIYKPHYHPTGFIYAAVGDDAYAKVVATAEAHPANWEALPDAPFFHSSMPHGVLTGDFPGWRGFWRKQNAGWVAARQTMRDLHTECERLGIQFVFGEKGNVIELSYNETRTDVLGARTADGTQYVANRTILAAGAGSDMLLNFRKQLRPSAWTLAHIPLSQEETKIYRDLPVLYCADRGFFIEPNEGQTEMKICDEHPGYINLLTDTKLGEQRSRPFSKEQIPLDAEQRMRRLLRETMPQLADRGFSYARVCWDADTPDRLFLIDQHPEYCSLVVAVGGSGHGFMCSPAVGRLVADLLDGSIEPRLRRMLQWRPDTAVDRDWYATQGRFGANGKVMSFQDVTGWTNIGRCHL